jgi:hypothetical protein
VFEPAVAHHARRSITSGGKAAAAPVRDRQGRRGDSFDADSSGAKTTSSKSAVAGAAAANLMSDVDFDIDISNVANDGGKVSKAEAKSKAAAPSAESAARSSVAAAAKGKASSSLRRTRRGGLVDDDDDEDEDDEFELEEDGDFQEDEVEDDEYELEEDDDSEEESQASPSAPSSNARLRKLACGFPGCQTRCACNSGTIVHDHDRRMHFHDPPRKLSFISCKFSLCIVSSALVIHRRIHTGERPFKCNHVGCEYKAGNPFSLNHHKLSHNTGKKRWACQQCSYATDVFFRLTRHISGVHERVRSFCCSMCGRQFAQKGNWKLHMRNVHSK